MNTTVVIMLLVNWKLKNGPLTKSTFVRVSGNFDPAGTTSVRIVQTAVKTNRLTNPVRIDRFRPRPPCIPVKLLTKLSRFTDSTVNSISTVDREGIVFEWMQWHSVDVFYLSMTVSMTVMLFTAGALCPIRRDPGLLRWTHRLQRS